jgi:hypothetical protein
MKKKLKKVWVYEIQVPFHYCECYLVEATSKKEAWKLFDPTKNECIGEISSRRRRVIRLRTKRVK